MRGGPCGRLDANLLHSTTKGRWQPQFHRDCKPTAPIRPFSSSLLLLLLLLLAPRLFPSPLRPSPLRLLVSRRFARSSPRPFLALAPLPFASPRSLYPVGPHIFRHSSSSTPSLPSPLFFTFAAPFYLRCSFWPLPLAPPLRETFRLNLQKKPICLHFHET